jgi:subtilisin-like proprotein convertase family protein
VPIGSATNSARVMVRGAGNIFYALNSTNFTIQAAEFVMNFLPGASINAICAPGTITYNFTYNTFLGFNDVTTFSASGNPAGTTVSFTPTTAQANGTNVAMVISGITPAMVGNYTITITGTAASTTKSTNVILNVFSNTFNAITLLSPVNGATNISGPHTFTWQADVNATSYDIEIATDNAFTNIVENVTGITNTSYTSSSLLPDTEYFWRIKPVNQCGNGGFSSVFSVTTANCFTIMSTNVPVTIPTSVSTVTSTINVTNTGTINDVNVVDLIGNHSWINDLIVELESPQGTKITLWDQICGNEDNFDVNFDDAATPGALPCPPVGGGIYQPQGSLTAFNGQNPQGTWILSIQDVFNQDGGALTSWGLNICLNSTVSSLNDLDNLSTIKAFPNPATHELTLIGLSIEKTTNFTITDITGKVVLTPRNQASIQQKIDISSLANGIYFLKVNSNNAEKTIKFVKQ